MIIECIIQEDTSIVISPEGSSLHDLSLDCVILGYLDTLNQMSDLGPGSNHHMPMFRKPFKNVALILLYFYVVFKVEPLTFTRVMCCDKEPFGLTRHVIYIIWYQ